MNRIFEDSYGRVLIQNGAYQVRMPTFRFKLLEPDYPATQFLHYDGETLSARNMAMQTVEPTFTADQLGEYINKVQQYKKLIHENVDQPIQQSDWDGLLSSLIETQAWTKVTTAMASSLKANTAGTLLIAALTATRRTEGLLSAWNLLLNAMQTQSAVPAFSDDELQTIKAALALNGFDAAVFFPES